jgi:anti-sigma B factor antagonist
MKSPHDAERGMMAPETLGLDTRVEIRKAAIKLLEEMPEGIGRLVIDLSRTRNVDSAGLGALMLIQRRAAERRQVVVLRHVNDEIRFLLVLTKLDDLFQLESAGGSSGTPPLPLHA